LVSIGLLLVFSHFKFEFSRMITNIRKVVVWAILVLSFAPILWAQRYTYRQYGSQDGLNNQSIDCLLQDRTGYLWVGTDNGLFRYDGTRFREFSIEDGLPNTEIRGLAESKDGVLWVTTANGVAQRKGDRFSSVETGLRGDIHGIGVDRVGRLYFGAESGMVRGLPNAGGTYQFEKIISEPVLNLFVSDGSVWFAKDGDLWQLEGTSARAIGTAHGLPAAQWQQIVQDSIGNLWVRSPNTLYELPKNRDRFVNRSKGIPPIADGSSMYADRHGRVFVSSDLGVVVFDGDHQTMITSRTGLPADAVGPIFLDRDESLWLGSRSGLIRRLGHGEWLSWKKEDGLTHSTIWAVLESSSSHSIWVGNGGGIDILSSAGKVERSWTRRNGLGGDRVFSIAEAPSGDIFAAADPASISRFNRKGNLLRTYKAESGVVAERIYNLAFDQHQKLWVGARGGCFRSRSPVTENRNIEFERVQIPGLPSSLNIYDIVSVDSNTVWLATSRGLVRFNDGQWKVFTQADGLKVDNVSVVVQANGALWIAYRNTVGITRVIDRGDRIETTHFTRADGLLSERVYAIATDASGRLWVASDNGIDVRTGEGWRHYGKEDGLISQDTDGLAMYLDRERNMWVGTSDGLSRFSALAYSVPETDTSAVITSVTGGSRSFRAEETPELPYRHSTLTITFSSLNYAYEGSVKFRYRLSGFENNWIETHERNVQFGRLPAGRYVFEVSALGPDGQWSQSPAKFIFFVRPPWWQSWWFLTVGLLIPILLAMLVWKVRVRVLVAQKKQLEAQVAERTAELHERRLQLLAATDAARLGIWSQDVDLDGQPLEESIKAVFKTSKDGRVDFENVLSVLVDDERVRFQQIMTRPEAPDTGDAGFECSTMLPDNKSCWLQVRGGVVDDARADVKRIAGVVMDVTAQKLAEQKMEQLEDQLLQSQKMEAVGRLAGGIAHDFNNLLMIVQNYADMMNDGLPFDSDLRVGIAQILKATDRGSALTSQLLAFSRKQMLSPSVLNLREVVTEATSMLSRIIGESVDLRLACDDDLWLVKADPNQIVQVLMNLCVNARDAMPFGGTLSIQIRNFTVTGEVALSQPDVHGGEYVSLLVSDTGVGMSKEVQEHLFEPFFTTKERHKGTGLGLPTVFGIVSQSGGHIRVESEPEKGSCFTILLPRAEGIQTPETRAKASADAEQMGMILVAEDEAPLRETVCRYLRNLGYTVVEASSGDEALSVAAQCADRIDLLVTDIIMPKMNGGELSRRLRERDSEIKIIYMSGYTDDETVLACIKEGEPFLQKPFRLAVLANKISKLLTDAGR
jgi:signal transduction histidine kinase/ligand-binding sensor domain-containing protein/CheY-like chemotaxis protein